MVAVVYCVIRYMVATVYCIVRYIVTTVYCIIRYMIAVVSCIIRYTVRVVRTLLVTCRCPWASLGRCSWMAKCTRYQWPQQKAVYWPAQTAAVEC